VTCYQRHIGWLFEALDLEYEKGNRQRVDSAIRDAIGTPAETQCPQVWSAIKTLSEDERTALIHRVGDALQRDS
jgi:hypothetical protein